jgi:hypothetical protein
LVGLQTSGRFVVKDDYGNMYANVGLDDLGRENGCSAGICSGQSVIAVDSVKDMIVLAVDSAGNFSVRDNYGNVYSNIPRSDLAVKNGCGALCVGQRAIALDSNKSVTILALEIDGTFVIQDDYGNRYANIPISDLASQGPGNPPPPPPGGGGGNGGGGQGLWTCFSSTYPNVRASNVNETRALNAAIAMCRGDYYCRASISCMRN